MLIRPRPLSPGDTLGVVAPASAPPDPQAVDRGVAALEALGFKVKLAPRVRRRLGYLAGTDRERAADLMGMFTDRRVRGILCVRGGYGTARLLPRLDYQTIRANPKVFVGYSDVTALHCAFLTKARLVSFHGPMLNSDFIHPAMPAFTRRSFLDVVGSRAEAEAGASRSISEGYRRRTVRVLRSGMARGQLIGGNLSLLVTLIGTPWQPDFRGRILFFEEIGEPPYRIDRMLTHLLNAGLLQQVAGVAIGINADCEDPKARTSREYRQTVADVVLERLRPLKIPVVSGLPFGHVPHNATIPIGVQATLDAVHGKGDLRIDEAAVR